MALMRENRNASLKQIDYYPTPPRATEALCEWLEKEQPNWLNGQSVLEPAAGGGHMFNILAEFFKHTVGSDLYDPAYQDFPQLDFTDRSQPLALENPDWIITNPPFKHVNEFVLRALDEATVGVAMLCRLAFLESIKRYESIFKNKAPSHVLVFSDRVPFKKNEINNDTNVRSAMCVAWFIWNFSITDEITEIDWLRYKSAP